MQSRTKQRLASGKLTNGANEERRTCTLIEHHRPCPICFCEKGMCVCLALANIPFQRGSDQQVWMDSKRASSSKFLSFFSPQSRSIARFELLSHTGRQSNRVFLPARRRSEQVWLSKPQVPQCSPLCPFPIDHYDHFLLLSLVNETLLFLRTICPLWLVDVRTTSVTSR